MAKCADEMLLFDTPSDDAQEACSPAMTWPTEFSCEGGSLGGQSFKLDFDINTGFGV